jgi:CubicO group peptidase (beta-lactamase class C family)
MTMKNHFKIWTILFFTIIVYGCSVVKEKSQYERLVDYEGRYEYTNPESLVLAASNYDTTLYAIIDDAQYPLKYVSKDTFETPQKSPLVFKRNGKEEVVSYLTDGKTFSLITKTIEKQEWFPRKELHNKAEAYQYRIPTQKTDGLLVGDLKNAFAGWETIVNMVKETIDGEFRDVHSILIWKDGKLVLEEYFYGYTEEKPHQLRSASKSFIGTLVGISIDQGKVKSENELLLPLFKKEYSTIANRDIRKEKITIKDFLTYRHGMDCNDENPNTAGHEQKMMESNDWVKFTLDLPMIEEPGVKSSYCTGCAQTLGRMVEVVTQTPLVEYADRNLFTPMGITNYKWRFKPDTSSISTFNQMYLRPRDILKIAIMYLDKGKWQGKQIVSSEWIRRTFEKDDVEFGYLWRQKYFDVDGKRYNSYLATGNGGQKINIWPELNMITVFTGGNYNSYLYGRTTPPNEMIPNYILKALE